MSVIRLPGRTTPYVHYTSLIYTHNVYKRRPVLTSLPIPINGLGMICQECPSCSLLPLISRGAYRTRQATKAQLIVPCAGTSRRFGRQAGFGQVSNPLLSIPSCSATVLIRGKRPARGSCNAALVPQCILYGICIVQYCTGVSRLELPREDEGIPQCRQVFIEDASTGKSRA